MDLNKLNKLSEDALDDYIKSLLLLEGCIGIGPKLQCSATLEMAIEDAEKLHEF